MSERMWRVQHVRGLRSGLRLRLFCPRHQLHLNPLLKSDIVLCVNALLSCSQLITVQVYSCGYQALAIGTLQVCGLGTYFPPSPIPYFPAPADAPGECSCNVAAAFNSIAEYGYLSTQCSRFGYPSSSTCLCCSFSVILSS